MTRNLTKKAHEFKNLLDDAIKSLVKKNIDSLKILISKQSDTIKELLLKITKIKEKVTTNAKSIAKPDKKVFSLESKLIYMEMQDNSKARKR